MSNPNGNHAKFLAMTAALTLLNACELMSKPEVDGRACPQTQYIGSTGCAELTIIVEAPDVRFAAQYILGVWATAMRQNVGFQSTFVPAASIGTNQLRLVQLNIPQETFDTVSVAIVARLFEDPRGLPVGVPFGVKAMDSIAHVAHFSPVGDIPRIDTLRLTLR